MTDIELYKELISFCEQHHEEIESKFQRTHQFDSINEECYKKMFLAQRKTSAPIAPKILKEEIPGLTEDINIPDNLIQETYDAVTNPMSGCISDTIARAGILARITRESAIHKHVAYISEDEIRMIVPSNGEVFHNKIGSFIKPYVKYQIPISAITDITIGPCIKNSDHIKSIVRMIEKKLGPKVDIKYSSIPYRG